MSGVPVESSRLETTPDAPVANSYTAQGYVGDLSHDEGEHETSYSGLALR